MGVGLLIICDDCVAIEDVEFDLVGLGGGNGAGDAEGAKIGVVCRSKEAGADTAVGVGIGVGCADDAVDIAGDGCAAVGT